MMGEVPTAAWMTTNWLLACFGPDQIAARQAYHRFIMAGLHADSPLKKVSFRCILGDATFIALHRESAKESRSAEIARVQRRALALSLEEYALTFTPREVAMAEAYRSTAFSMQQIAVHFCVSVKTVSRAVAAS